MPLTDSPIHDDYDEKLQMCARIRVCQRMDRGMRNLAPGFDVVWLRWVHRALTSASYVRETSPSLNF